MLVHGRFLPNRPGAGETYTTSDVEFNHRYHSLSNRLFLPADKSSPAQRNGAAKSDDLLCRHCGKDGRICISGGNAGIGHPMANGESEAQLQFLNRLWNPEMSSLKQEPPGMES